MPWSELDYQKRAVLILTQSIKNNKASHAYLFFGSKGSGKLLAARLFAQALNCETNELDPCGVCKSCDMLKRSMNTENVVHPDLMHLVPGNWIMASGKKQAGHTIVVDAVRDICSKLYSSPLQAKRRIVIVHEADTMQAGAQNAFLKTLEEPMERIRTTFILLSANPDKLLPTIHSRCQNIHFGTLSTEIIKDIIAKDHDFSEEQLDKIAMLSSGSLDEAERLALDEIGENADFSEREELLNLWHEASYENPSQLLGIVKRFSGSRDVLAEFLGLLVVWHRDLLVLSEGASEKNLVNIDYLTKLKQQASVLTSKQIIERIEKIEETIDSLLRYSRADLALTNLLLEIKQTII